MPTEPRPSTAPVWPLDKLIAAAAELYPPLAEAAAKAAAAQWAPGAAAITRLTDDSRAVGACDEAAQRDVLFVAARGATVDGHRFLPQVLASPATAAVVVERLAEDKAAQAAQAGIAVLTVPDSREALGAIAHAWHGFPSRQLQVFAVTGTNGKTTSAYLLEQAMQAAGHRPGVIGTIEYRHPGRAVEAENTTPSALKLAAILAEMRDAGCTAVAMEASSHAIHQRRISGIEFDAAILTNITQDHLDYHGTMAAYAEAKRELFSDFLARPSPKRPGRVGVALLNTDNRYGQQFWAARSLISAHSFSMTDPAADYFADQVHESGSGFEFLLRSPRLPQPLAIRSGLVGSFNVMNVLGVVAALIESGAPPEAVAGGLAQAHSAPGRFERVAVPGAHKAAEISVFIDYAHTPDALERVLETARPLTARKLWCVFGCGGDRDAGKRALMGAAAARLADHLIITNDNPRTEDPAAIAAQIEVGAREHGARPTVLLDRREAIQSAIRQAEPGDTVIIAGKGHETYQILGSTKTHFDDREEALAALSVRRPS